MNNIRLFRKKFGYSQQKVVELLADGATQASVSLWETGRIKPSRERQERLAEIFNTTVSELMNVSELTSTVEQPVADMAEESPSLTDIEKHLLDCFRSVDESGKRMILSVADLEYERRRNEIVG